MSQPSVFLSFVIPVYNGASNGLDICLNSIWNSNIPSESYEIICVDDCSTDDSVSFIRQLQNEHTNLKLLKNVCNIRQGGSKNRGIREASGEYICFIDQDDYYHPGGINAVFEHLKQTDLDILICNNIWQRIGAESGWKQLNLHNTDIFNSGRAYVESNGFTIAPWRMICRRRFLLKNNLYFVEKTRIEDIDWGCKTIMAAKKLQYMPILLLHYNRYENQTTSLMKKNILVLKDQFWVAQRVFLYAQTIEPNFPQLKSLYMHHFKVAIRMLLGCYAGVETKKEIINTYCSGVKFDNKILNLIVCYPGVYANLSNVMIPFYRLFIFFVNWYHWHFMWR